MSYNQNNIIQENSEVNEVSIKELIYKIKQGFNFLKSKYKIIILSFLIGGLFGIAISKLYKPKYKATLSFVLEEDNGGSNAVGMAGIASQLGLGMSSNGGSIFSGANLMALMKSRFLVEKTLLSPILVNGKQITFAEYYIQINDLRSKDKNKSYSFYQNINFPINSNSSTFTIKQVEILKDIYSKVTDPKNLIISQKDKKVSITSLDVLNENENFAKEFCEALAKITSDYYIEIKSKKAKINVDILQKQVDSIRGEINSAIIGVASASDNVYNLNPAFNVKRTPSTKRQVDVQANSAILSQLVAQLELSKVSLRKETPLIQLIDRPVLPLENDKLGPKKSFFIGACFVSFLTILFLITQKLYKKIIA
jgi:hypothetical protein